MLVFEILQILKSLSPVCVSFSSFFFFFFFFISIFTAPRQLSFPDSNAYLQTPNHQAKTGKEEKSLHDHLSPGKQRVADELACPQGNGSVGHDVVE